VSHIKNSIETYIILHSFTPCVDDELEVKEGQLVVLLYRENDWAYVVMENREGFIPWSYLEVFEEVAKEEKEGEEFYKVGVFFGLFSIRIRQDLGSLEYLKFF
jgi:hypothetical protein